MGKELLTIRTDLSRIHQVTMILAQCGGAGDELGMPKEERHGRKVATPRIMDPRQELEQSKTAFRKVRVCQSRGLQWELTSTTDNWKRTPSTIVKPLFILFHRLFFGKFMVVRQSLFNS
jgi:hypothetical protein